MLSIGDKYNIYFQFFQSRLVDKISKFYGYELTDDVLISIDNTIDLVFEETSTLWKGFRLPFKNMLLISGTAIAVDKKTIFINYRAITDDPPNFPRPGLRHTALGMYKGIDLYMGLEENEIPYLIIKYGEDRKYYKTFDPQTDSIKDMGQLGEFIQEAFRRAALINSDVFLLYFK